jgi:hypothetical protein
MGKKNDCIVYGTLAGIGAVIGGGVIVFNPLGWVIIAGTALISGGLGGIANSVSQYHD